ncbi:MAG: hypothetical protein K2Y25_16695 [Pseudomonadaceae bacterium]|nr:hypothetical protein [Pseudomonadaceae bacterium]
MQKGFERLRVILPAHQAYQVKKWAEAVKPKVDEKVYPPGTPFWQKIPREVYWRDKFLRSLTNFQSGIACGGEPTTLQQKMNQTAWLAAWLQELGGLEAVW